MVGKIREMVNEAPPWVTYAVAGTVVAIAVGVVVYQLMPASTGGSPGDKHFYCADCDDGFTVSAEKARDMLREAAKANPGQRAMAKCPKCNKFTCIIGLKCEKCGKYFEMPEKSGGIFPTSWRDECPHCGFSAQRDRAVRAALKQKAEGKYDPDKIPPFIREAVEDAERSGEYKDVEKK
ncbi:MAG: hypothetical protein JXQ73_21165 [Phycisphaerae bacterium]|nr:hypothetical protein [Phycisphaerae bacterium]